MPSQPGCKMSFNGTKALEIAKYALEDIEDPVNIIPVALLALCFLWSGLPRGNSKALAIWALFNGCIIHCWMDGFIGMFGRGPKWMVVQYGKLDARYWPTKDPCVMIVSAVELVIMGPLCILWYNAIVKNLWYKHFLSLVVSTFQLMGTFLYCGTEALLGFKHVSLDWPPKFDTFDKIFYFWIIYVFANNVWVFVPTGIIVRTLTDMKPIYEQAENKKQVKKGKAKKTD